MIYWFPESQKDEILCTVQGAFKKNRCFSSINMDAHRTKRTKINKMVCQIKELGCVKELAKIFQNI